MILAVMKRNDGRNNRKNANDGRIIIDDDVTD